MTNTQLYALNGVSLEISASDAEVYVNFRDATHMATCEWSDGSRQDLPCNLSSRESSKPGMTWVNFSWRPFELQRAGTQEVPTRSLRRLTLADVKQIANREGRVSYERVAIASEAICD